MRAIGILFSLVLLSCDNRKDEGHTGAVVDTDDSWVDTGWGDDLDRDGYSVVDDCDDADGGVNPGATEACDGIDNDCDGMVDEEGGSAWYTDADGDGYGDALTGSCEQEEGTVALGGDCDDADAAVNPAAGEQCDEIDNDCDGEVDNDIVLTWYRDADGDGFGDAEAVLDTCDPPEGWVADATDCDDVASSTFPGADELCNGVDDDCDSEIDEDAVDAGTWYTDADGDNYGDDALTTVSCEQPEGTASEGADCDESDAEVNPGTAEQCDGIDNDCDGAVDEEVVYTWYSDADGDGYGDPAAALDTCDPPAGSSPTGDDCDDATATTNPGADELCNDVDDDCDGEVDDDPVDGVVEYTDSDGDGLGDPESATASCASLGEGWVEDGTDCDDSSVDVGAADTWYTDGDGDGYGDSASGVASCEQPEGTIADGSDCDDADSGINPDAVEACDGVDEDCDGEADDGATDGTIWYYDDDEDGYGDPATSTSSCEAPDEFVSDDTDCDDLDAAVNPMADEVCNDVDDDCDGEVDEDASDALTWYSDGDGDGYGLEGDTVTGCDVPSGYAASTGDCDDADPAYNPGAVEDDCADPNDYNCDGATGYADGDGDGYAACEECDDADSAVNPAGVEICDGLDNDCDGTVDGGASDADTWYADSDEDGYGDSSTGTLSCEAPEGYGETDGDCDDADASAYPDAVELCDSADNDCDGSVDEDAPGATSWYEDGDGDGYGDAASSTTSCDAPAGYVADATDCNDDASTAWPGNSEYCSDSIDNDCDGSKDEADAVDARTYYLDSDSDTYGDPDISTRACSRPRNYRGRAKDCDDSNAMVNPAYDEICDELDNDCDSLIDEGVTDGTTWYYDGDGDGYGDPSVTSTGCEAPDGYVAAGTDCDDEDDAINPGSAEVCDGVDNDCDGAIDGADAIDADDWYADLDADGFGDPEAGVTDCEAPSGYTADDQDCDDLDGDVNPDAEEVCNGLDDDCDGGIDDGASGGTSTWYYDGDDDGYGDDASSVDACDAPDGYVASGGDCDDADSDYNPGADESDCRDRNDYNCDGSTGYADEDDDGWAACEDCDDGDADVYPGGTETCDDADNDCDGEIDESGAAGESRWYEDGDGDGYGDASSSARACDAPDGFVADDTDCDDADVDVHPDALELCNGADDDCDGVADDGAADTTTWHRDSDRDGFGDAGSTRDACDAPSGYVLDDTDCDDTSSAINPDEDEVCDDLDNDCDGRVDESAVDAGTWYADEDGDGFGDASSVSRDCDRPADHVGDDTDCNDGDEDINPDAAEVCNGLDDNCDGEVDEDTAVDAETWYYDDDGDGYGDAALDVTACDAPADYVSSDQDCDDGDEDVNPAATDVCDGVDNDCSDAVDDGGLCACNVEYYDDGTYLYCETAAAWSSARTTCQSYGYDLLTVNDADENAWAVETANTYSTAKWWIGFNDISTEGSWVWASGESASYTNWHSGEPNNAGNEDCAQFNRFSDETWNDEPCSSSFRFICEL